MTKFVGILNITPDSFFDGGKYDEENNAVMQLENLLKKSADIIDIGAESTRPNATSLSADEEWERLKNILPKAIKIVTQHNLENQRQVEISLDSRHHQNVVKALELGIDIINDVSGFKDSEMVLLAAKSGKKIILMHNLGIPADKNKIIDVDLDAVEIVINWGQIKIEQLQKAGVKKEQIIFDPGIGFGKNSTQSIELLKQIDRLRILDLPLYVGHSNKSFLDYWDIENCINREEKTAAVSQYLIEKNVEYLRLHKVK